MGRGPLPGPGKANQATIAESGTENIGSQILERRLSIPDWLALHDPLSVPDL